MDGCRRNMRRRSVSGCGGAGLPAQLRHAFCLRSERDFRPRFAAYFRAGRQAVPADLPAYRPGDKRYMLCLQGRDGDRIRGLLRYADERRHGPDADTRRHRHERQRVYAQPLVRLLHKGQHLSRRPVIPGRRGRWAMCRSISVRPTTSACRCRMSVSRTG